MSVVAEDAGGAVNLSSRAWPAARGGMFGCLRALQRNPLEFYDGIWRQHGDYVRIRLLPRIYIYMLVSPVAVEHVLYKNHKNYRKPDMLNRAAATLMGNGLFTSEGAFWLRQRRLCQPAFARSQMERLSGFLTGGVADLIEEWRRTRLSAPFDVVPDMMRLALRVASTALFSKDVSGEADVLGAAFRATFAYMSDRLNGRFALPLWAPTPRNREVSAARATLDRVVLDIVEARRKSGERRQDVLDMLLAAQDEETGQGMTDQQLKDEVVTLLTAGHETTGAALAWTWHLLTQHPEVQQSLHDEVHGRLKGSPPTFTDLPHLPLATAVFEESMRLYPPAWGLPRETIGVDEIEGRALPAKTTIVLSQFSTHRHPDYWSDPERFDPSRFLGAAKDGRPRCAYFPFGGGPRICIGNQFAMLEGTLILAALAQQFQFTAVPGHTVQLDPTFTLRPKNGVLVTLRSRDRS